MEFCNSYFSDVLIKFDTNLFTVMYSNKVTHQDMTILCMWIIVISVQHAG